MLLAFVDLIAYISKRNALRAIAVEALLSKCSIAPSQLPSEWLGRSVCCVKSKLQSQSIFVFLFSRDPLLCPVAFSMQQLKSKLGAPSHLHMEVLKSNSVRPRRAAHCSQNVCGSFLRPGDMVSSCRMPIPVLMRQLRVCFNHSPTQLQDTAAGTSMP